MSKTYIKVTEESGKRYFSKEHPSPIYMLNLLRFKDVADYSDYPELAPENEISGSDAYGLYSKNVFKLLMKANSEVLFSGKADHYLIGPQDEKWDAVLLVKHQSSSTFLAFASDPGYKKIEGHRTAALADSRLLPVTSKQ